MMRARAFVRTLHTSVIRSAGERCEGLTRAQAKPRNILSHRPIAPLVPGLFGCVCRYDVASLPLHW